MRMTCKYANNMWTMSRCDMQRKPSTQIISQIIYMILKWTYSTSLWQIVFNNQFLSQWKDSLNLQWPWEVPQMTCQHPSHLHMTCRRHADDVRMTYVIRHLKSPTKSHSRVTHTSSARRLRVVCTSSAVRTHETSVPRLFQVKHQRTPLLKTKQQQKYNWISWFHVMFLELKTTRLNGTLKRPHLLV